ncbi:Piwi-domain-containing protein [Hypoxylon trugodes]|uniref:Piwi-domain-containing protein n=1 Tax=Hypoxylon trugodes TaxID=326681 RepID=UPI00219ACF53|nr:Piwi-domain-containing protein [Hypoxylon trugodes]KAI1386230.1 Piwi-domain-containing protein [Hypoxylon trugodes]
MSAWNNRGTGGGGGGGSQYGGGGQYDRDNPFRGGRGGGQRGGGQRGGGGGYRGGGGRGGRGGFNQPAQIFTPAGGAPAPNSNVTMVENAIQASKGSANIANLNLEERFPARPSYGTKGAPVTLWANYFALTLPSKLVLYRYEVEVKPEATGKKRVQIIRLLLESPDLAPLQADVVTDFKSTLISRKKFENKEFSITYKAEDEDEPREGARKTTVTLKFTNLLDVSALSNYLNSTNFSARYDEKLPMIQGFNIFLNHFAKSAGNLATIGASKTFTMGNNSDTYDLGKCLIAMRGFFASVRAATARVLVNVNVAHGAFYQPWELEEMISRYNAATLYKLEGFLKKVRVETKHLPKRKNKSGKVILRAKTIFGLANGNDGYNSEHPPRVRAFGAGAKDVEFWLDDKLSPKNSPASTPGRKKGGKGAQKPATSGGRYISVYDHFYQVHKITITNPRMPVVNVGNRENPSYLPAQVCKVLPGQPAKAKLDPDQTSSMIKFAVRPPSDNATSIMNKGRQTAGLAPDVNPRLGQFGITVSTQLITVQSRVLPSPNVMYRQNQKARVDNGSWNMAPRDGPRSQFSSSTILGAWTCLYLGMPQNMYYNATRLDQNGVLGIMKTFSTVMQQTGIQMGAARQAQLVQLSDNDDPKLEEVIQRLAGMELQLVLVIVPSNQTPLYDRIKQLADVKYGIHTVCSVGSKITKAQGQDQYLTNEALKVNLKLGGNNHFIDPLNLGIISENKTMVVGIDVTHPSPGSSAHARSVAGMVASVDNRLGQWPGILSIQKARQEMVTNMKDMLKSRLNLWRTKGKHDAYPENILVYRDGVSEGQYKTVLDDELPLLREACQEVYSAPDQKKGLPRITLIVVGKRHHTRFYPTKASDADRSGNARSGTVVDRGVTEARSWDFFLQAHAAIKGTARPAHYFVLIDEIFRQRYGNKSKTPGKNISDELQELTQSMSYVFGRATKAVSYCTPAYYADILCERSRRYLKDEFETPGNSTAPSTAGSAAAPGAIGTTSQVPVTIHPRLRDSMFYI